MAAWNWAHQPPDGAKQNALASVVSDLAHALRANPELKLLVLCGHYDLMTPFFGMEYDLGKLYLSHQSQHRIRIQYYEAGHMLHVAAQARGVLAADVHQFYDYSLNKLYVSQS